MKEEDRFPHVSCLQDHVNLTKQVLATTMECLERLIDRVDTLENDMKAMKALEQSRWNAMCETTFSNRRSNPNV